MNSCSCLGGTNEDINWNKNIRFHSKNGFVVVVFVFLHFFQNFLESLTNTQSGKVLTLAHLLITTLYFTTFVIAGTRMALVQLFSVDILFKLFQTSAVHTAH